MLASLFSVDFFFESFRDRFLTALGPRDEPSFAAPLAPGCRAQALRRIPRIVINSNPRRGDIMIQPLENSTVGQNGSAVRPSALSPRRLNSPRGNVLGGVQ